MKQQTIKLIIADDDAMLRIGLKTMLPWEQYGYQIVGEAKDGKEAVALCASLHPDLLITDMKMAEADGIEVLRRLSQWEQRPQVIVLSGYDEFALVREAMRLGASDYLLKLELSPARLLACLQAVRQKVRLERAEAEKAGGRDWERTLRNLISHFYLTNEEMDRALQQAGIRFETQTVYCMLIRAGDWFRFEDADEEENRTLQYAMGNIAMEIVSGCMTAYCVSGKTGELYVFAGLKQAYAGRGELVKKTAERLRNILKKYLDIHCVIAVGSGAPDASGLSQACRQAVETMRRRFCVTADGILWWQEVSLLHPASHNPALARCSAELFAGLNTLDWPQAERALDDLLEAWKHAALSHAGMLQAVAELQNGVCECLERCGRPARQVLVHSYRDLRAILMMNSSADCMAWLKSMQEDIALFFSLEDDTAVQTMVQKAVGIIEARYAQPITLRDLAEELHFSPGYLSVRIKQQIGMNFSEYLLHVRMREARRLLVQTDEKIAEIARRVGYTDQFYFSRLFKRATGRTPSEYRRQGEDMP